MFGSENNKEESNQGNSWANGSPLNQANGLESENFRSSIFSTADQQLLNFKIILVGSSGVGKTSLTKRCVDDIFES